MIYKALQWLVEWLKDTYKCPECKHAISETDIDIIWAAWTSVNFNIICPKCWKSWIVQSQLMTIDVKWIEQIQNSIENITKTNKITDNEITSLDKDLKTKQINVSDLFN